MRATQFVRNRRVAFNPFAIVPQCVLDDELNIAENQIAEEIRITGRCKVLDGPPAEWGNRCSSSRVIDRWKADFAAAKYQREFEKEEDARKAKAGRTADLEWEEAGRKSAETQAALVLACAAIRQQREEQESAARMAAWRAESDQRKQSAAEAKEELRKEIESWGSHFGPQYDPAHVEWRPSGDGLEARFGGRTIFVQRDVTNLIARIKNAT